MATDPADRPGDAPCWQCRVCPDCGSIADTDPPPPTCAQCGAAVPGPEPR